MVDSPFEMRFYIAFPRSPDILTADTPSPFYIPSRNIPPVEGNPHIGIISKLPF